MLAPSLTDVLRRRIFASLVDLGLVGLVSGFVARTQFETFRPTDVDDLSGNPIYSAADIDRLNVLRGSFNRLIERGDTLHVIDLTGTILTVTVALLTGLLLFVLLPSNGGWSPGQKLFGLRVVDAKGEDAGLGANLVRTVAGLIDGFPWFLPGLLGWLLARGDIHHRRLGDRLGKTFVIDGREPITFVDPATLEARAQRRQRRAEAQATAETASASTDLDSMVDLDNRLAAEAEAGLEAGMPDAPDFSMPDAPAADLDSGFHVPDDLMPETPGLDPRVEVDAGLPPMPTADTTAPPPFDLPDLTPTPVTDGFDTPPAPVADPISSAAASPAPEAAPADAAFSIDLGADPATSTVRSERRARAPRPTHRTPPAHRSAAPAADGPGEWDAPVASTAPVWQPDGTAAGTEPQASGVTEPQASGIDEFSLDPAPEAGAGELGHLDDASFALGGAAAAPTSGAEASGPDPDDVVWNDQWQAWLYWDANGGRWMRHEPDRNVWIPIS